MFGKAEIFFHIPYLDSLINVLETLQFLCPSDNYK